MSETCPARGINPSNGAEFIGEPYIPDSCLSCIARAEGDPAATKTVTDRYDAALTRAREYIGDLDMAADRFDRWQAIGLQPPGEGLGRKALRETGFDLGFPYGSSYHDGTESEVTELEFDCYSEAGAEPSAE